MEIVFLCGSLEPGKDGVGDYTRRLAASLCKCGVTATVISLYDKQVDKITEQGQICDAVEIMTLRIPAHETASIRNAAAQKWIEKTNPEWVSLQFVPFSFQKKGLPFQLKSSVREWVKGRKLHIMFHELWVGVERYKSLKYWFWAQLQKHIINSLVKSLNPKIVHTQTQFYKQRLKELGIHADHLQLFSNIPKTNTATTEKLVNGDQITIIVFGSIYPDSQFRQFADECAKFAKDYSQKVTLVIVGRSGPETEQWTSFWRSLGLEIVLLGEQSMERISEELTKASVGITTTPYILVEKSGTVAAMLEHGLPVLCIAKPISQNKFKKVFDTPYITEYHQGKLAEYLTRKKKKTPDNGVDRVSADFLHSLRRLKGSMYIEQTNT